MPPLRKMQTATGKDMPHVGKMLAKLLNERRIPKTELARKLDVHSSGIHKYLKQSTLHAALLWKLGQILEYNFFDVLARQHPVSNNSQLEQELQAQVDELKKENALYQKILTGKEKN